MEFIHEDEHREAFHAVLPVSFDHLIKLWDSKQQLVSLATKSGNPASTYNFQLEVLKTH